MKKILYIFIGITFVALFVMLANIFITPMPDWAVRTAGITMLVSLLVTTFLVVRARMSGAKNEKD